MCKRHLKEHSRAGWLRKPCELACKDDVTCKDGVACKDDVACNDDVACKDDVAWREAEGVVGGPGERQRGGVM